MQSILRNKVLTAVLILLGGALYGAYELMEFMNGEEVSLGQERENLGREITNLKSDLNKVKKFAENIPAVKQSFREQSLQLESVLESIPRSFEFNVLLKKFDLLAQNAGIEILGFKPQSGEQDLGYFKSSTIDLSLRGGFIPTLVFLDQVSKLKRVVAFEEIKMNVSRDSGSKTNEGKVTSVVNTTTRLKAYKLGDS